MSCAWRISFASRNSAALLNHSSLKQSGIPIVFSPNAFYRWRRQMGRSANRHHQLRLNSVNNHDNVKESSDMRSMDQADSTGKVNHQEEYLTMALKKLKRYGISGVLSYGLLNTAYYLSTFLFVWLYIAPVPGRMGYVGAVERFLKVLAMVWAGSQVTKLIRAGGEIGLLSCDALISVGEGIEVMTILGPCRCLPDKARSFALFGSGAVALAPAVDKGLSWFTVKFKFESQAKAFMAIAGFCFGLAFLVFLVLTMLWA